MESISLGKNSRVVVRVALGVVAVCLLLFFTSADFRGAVERLGWGGGVNMAQIEKDRYYGVFLTNGQVYFGKISRLSDDALQLTDIYYLQSSDALQGAADGANAVNTNADMPSDATDLSLVKLGRELHGPEDNMIINPEHVLYYELLQQDSRVVRAIEKYRQGL